MGKDEQMAENNMTALQACDARVDMPALACCHFPTRLPVALHG